jgi:hypothetical protein
VGIVVVHSDILMVGYGLICNIIFLGVHVAYMIHKIAFHNSYTFEPPGETPSRVSCSACAVPKRLVFSVLFAALQVSQSMHT